MKRRIAEDRRMPIEKLEETLRERDEEAAQRARLKQRLKKEEKAATRNQVTLYICHISGPIFRPGFLWGYPFNICKTPVKYVFQLHMYFF